MAAMKSENVPKQWVKLWKLYFVAVVVCLVLHIILKPGAFECTGCGTEGDTGYATCCSAKENLESSFDLLGTISKSMLAIAMGNLFHVFYGIPVALIRKDKNVERSKSKVRTNSLVCLLYRTYSCIVTLILLRHVDPYIRNATQHNTCTNVFLALFAIKNYRFAEQAPMRKMARRSSLLGSLLSARRCTTGRSDCSFLWSLLHSRLWHKPVSTFSLHGFLLPLWSSARTSPYAATSRLRVLR